MNIGIPPFYQHPLDVNKRVFTDLNDLELQLLCPFIVNYCVYTLHR